MATAPYVFDEIDPSLQEQVCIREGKLHKAEQLNLNLHSKVRHVEI